MKKITKLITIIFSLGVLIAHSGTDPIPVTKIWDKASHNGFPDLLLFKNEFFCTLREADSHVSNLNSGKVRVIKSRDGNSWDSVVLFDLGEGIDMREARLSVTPSGQIMAIVAAGIFKDGRYLELATYVSYSDSKGKNFSPLEKVTFSPDIKPDLDWIWRVTWYNGYAYGIMYSAKYDFSEGRRTRSFTAQLLRSKDGKHYEHVSKLDVDGDPNESTIRFDKTGKMYIVIRRETGDQNGVIAESVAPYKKWEFHHLPYRLGGPNFLFLNDREVVLGTRFHEGTSTSTALHIADLKGNILKTIKLPSSGDNSYPGLVIHKKKLWVAYYSSHEGKSNIYFTSIPLKTLKR